MQEDFIFRRINIHTDLNQITDLIELCFGQQLDPDGKRYLQYLRNISNEPEKLDSSVFFTFQNTPLLDGYVCEEKGKIIGNVTLSSYTSENKKICFISNVAVSPAARNMGIATRLMKIALDHSKNQKYQSVWLQVRRENSVANHIYSGMGFTSRACRTTWIIENVDQHLKINSSIEITARRASDWNKQKNWLLILYPAELHWQLEMKIQEFSPLIWQSISNLLNGKQYVHFALHMDGRLLGVISRQSASHFADYLWLATSSENEELIIRDGLKNILMQMKLTKPLMINFPAVRGEHAFRQAGFKELNTLIWMENDLS